jgi:hypothetical protein
MPQLTFRCPLCEGAFQVASEDQGQAVACPHCGGAVATPSADAPAAGRGSEAADYLEAVAEPRSVSHALGTASTPRQRVDRGPPLSDPADRDAPPVRPREGRFGEATAQVHEIGGLTREQRAAFRRRVNLLVFAISAAILAIAVACLLLWSG